VQTATEHPEVRGLRFLLGTKDAHTLYSRFGFEPPVHPERMMEIRPDLAPPPSSAV
jgi:hypothetical protein